MKNNNVIAETIKLTPLRYGVRFEATTIEGESIREVLTPEQFKAFFSELEELYREVTISHSKEPKLPH